MGVGFATGVATKENDFLWLEAIADSISNLLNGDLGEHSQIACRRKSKGMARLKVLLIALTPSALGILGWARV